MDLASLIATDLPGQPTFAAWERSLFSETYMCGSREIALGRIAGRWILAPLDREGRVGSATFVIAPSDIAEVRAALASGTFDNPRPPR